VSTDALCPRCGAPCQRTVHARSGDWGWGTTDEQRATYEFRRPRVVAHHFVTPDGFWYGNWRIGDYDPKNAISRKMVERGYRVVRAYEEMK
jgi:hypothetical protein